MKSNSSALKAVMIILPILWNRKRLVLASQASSAPLFNCLDSCFRRSDMTVSFPRKRESIAAKIRHGAFSGEIDLYCRLVRLPDVGQPNPVRPEPVEGPFMVRQAHHERCPVCQFS